MVINANIRVEGIEKWTSLAARISSDLIPTVGQQLKDIAQNVVNDAQQAAPVDTGYLRDNIQITSQTDKEVVVESRAEYSGYVEYGTVYMQAQPFFEPAVRKARQDGPSKVQNALRGLFR
jgi:HK97 gp10 family phage protein